MCGVGAGAGPSFPERSGINDFVSELILSNNLSYNLHSFVWKSVHLEKSSSLKIAYAECKMIFPYVWCIKQYSLFLYLMNIINLEHGTSLLV